MAWVVTDLAPFQTNIYGMSHESSPWSATLSHDETPETFTSVSNAIGFTSSIGFGNPIAAINGQGGGGFYGSPVISHDTTIVARGPVWNEVRHQITLEDGTAVAINLKQWDRSNRFEVAVDVNGDSPTSGWRIALPDVHTWHQQYLWAGGSLAPPDTTAYDWFTRAIAELDDGVISIIRAYGFWVGEGSCVVCFEYGDDGREYHVGRLDPVKWTSLHYYIPILVDQGRVFIDFPFEHGLRQFYVGESAHDESVGIRHRRNSSGQRVGAYINEYPYGLEVVRHWVMSWDDTQAHPSALMTQSEIDSAIPAPALPSAPSAWDAEPQSNHARGLGHYLMTGTDDYDMLSMMESNLGLLGDFDKMRCTHQVCSQYDVMLPRSNNPRLMRARMAYLAYVTMDPTTWDASRGWASGNYNMHVAYRCLAPAWFAACMSSHPQAEQWRTTALEAFETNMAIIAPNGEWPESSHYAEHSLTMLVQVAMLLRRADDERLVRAIDYLIKIKPPKDPRMGNARVSVPYGRVMGSDHGLDGLVGKAAGIPRFNWSWSQEGNQTRSFADLGGFEYIYYNPTLPAEPITWQSELFPQTGILFRRDQDYCMLLSGDHTHMIYASQTGAIASLWYRGIPLGGSFVHNYARGQNEWTLSRVSAARHPRDYIARKSPFAWKAGSNNGFAYDYNRVRARYQDTIGDGNPVGLAVLNCMEYGVVDVAPNRAVTHSGALPPDLPWPEQPYGTATGPFKWRRQVAWIGHRYWVVRDTTDGTQPTHWSFWTASNGINTQGAGNAIEPPRALSGTTHRALGEHGCDLLYYVAQGGATKHTLRWGMKTVNNFAWGIEQYQDGLVLQDPSGTYHVALYPLESDDTMPVFGTLADGAVIAVTTAERTDYIMMAAERTVIDLDHIYFDTTCGLIRVEAGQVTLALGDAGEIWYEDHVLTSYGADEQVFPI